MDKEVKTFWCGAITGGFVAILLAALFGDGVVFVCLNVVVFGIFLYATYPQSKKEVHK